MREILRKFDVVYHNTRLGKPDVKRHVFVAKNRDEVFQGLKFWKGANPEDVISMSDLGEFTPQPGFMVKV